VPALEVHAAESIEGERLSGCAEQIPDAAISRLRLDVGRDLVEARLSHLRGDRALPDQPVEPSLVPVEDRVQLIGEAPGAGRTDRLVRLLSASLLLSIPARLGQDVLATELVPHHVG